jgi:hypothetical protein
MFKFTNKTSENYSNWMKYWMSKVPHNHTTTAYSSPGMKKEAQQKDMRSSSSSPERLVERYSHEMD